MQRIWFKKKQTIGVVIAVIIIYVLLRPTKYDYAASIVIPKIHPSDAWEFVADFSNMKYLNPTIIDFTILSESGNYDHWKYTVEYVENLSHWPHLSNTAVANFDVKALPRQNVYFILSSHRTCFLLGLFCLESASEFKFSKESTGALCEEYVEYQCPMLMSRFCEREVKFQRSAIMNNLKKYFVNKK